MAEGPARASRLCASLLLMERANLTRKHTACTERPVTRGGGMKHEGSVRAHAGASMHAPSESLTLMVDRKPARIRASLVENTRSDNLKSVNFTGISQS